MTTAAINRDLTAGPICRDRTKSAIPDLGAVAKADSAQRRDALAFRPIPEGREPTLTHLQRRARPNLCRLAFGEQVPVLVSQFLGSAPV